MPVSSIFAGSARRAEALAAIQAKQHGAAASVREAAERRQQAETARLAQLADKQRRKQEAQVCASSMCTTSNMLCCEQRLFVYAVVLHDGMPG